MNAAKVSIYILTYNRPTYIEECVRSALGQDYSSFEVIVSDNSTNDSTLRILEKFKTNPNLVIRSRSPSVPSVDHFNLVLNEARSTAPYFMLFHDDDVLLPSALSTLMRAFARDATLAAVGGNGYVLKNFIKSNQVIMRGKDRYISILQQLVDCSFDLSVLHSPFPSYVYRADRIRNIQFDSRRGGKHFDFTFLMDILSNSPILMLAQPVMYYREHATNDSVTYDARAAASLERGLKRLPNLSLPLVTEFKYKSYLRSVLQTANQNRSSLSKRNKVLLKSSAWFFFKHPRIILAFLFRRLSSMFLRR